MKYNVSQPFKWFWKKSDGPFFWPLKNSFFTALSYSILNYLTVLFYHESHFKTPKLEFRPLHLRRLKISFKANLLLEDHFYNQWRQTLSGNNPNIPKVQIPKVARGGANGPVVSSSSSKCKINLEESIIGSEFPGRQT